MKKQIETYLNIHVSDVHRHTEKIQHEWKEGRKAYFELINNTKKQIDSERKKRK